MGDDAGGETRWLSYGELAATRGISKASATRLAFRRKWPRQVGNDGTARVAVPMAELDGVPDATPDGIRDDARAVRGDIARTINGLRAENASLRERAEAAEGRVNELSEQVVELRVREGAALARADELRAIVDKLTAVPGAATWARLRRALPWR